MIQILPSAIAPIALIGPGITSLGTFDVSTSEPAEKIYVGATNYFGEQDVASATNKTGKELSAERWIEAKKYGEVGAYLIKPPIGAWTQDGDFWIPPAGAWYGHATVMAPLEEITPPVGISWAWDDVFFSFVSGPGTWQLVSDSSEINVITDVSVNGSAIHETDEFSLAPVDIQLNSPWVPIGGGRDGDVLRINSTATAAASFELRMNVPADAETAGDIFANIEVYQE